MNAMLGKTAIKKYKLAKPDNKKKKNNNENQH